MSHKKIILKSLAALVAQYCISTSALAGVDSLTIQNDETTISFLMYYSGPSPATARQLYIDTDLSRNTGFTIGGVGAEFFVSDGTFFRYIGKGGYDFSWDLNNTVPVSYSDDGSKAQWTIPRSLLPAVAGVHVAGNLKGAGWQSTSSIVPHTFSSPTQVLARDPLVWPFAQNSIWNMPIGRGATYVPANLPEKPGNNDWAGAPQVDLERIVLRPNAPSTAIFTSSAGWGPGANRCAPTGAQITSVPIPTDYVVENNNTNSSATFLMEDGRTLIQSQPFARCTAGGPATSQALLPPVDLYGPGILGAHGGSRLSAIGGSLRLGELRPGGQGPRHALKLNVYAAQVLYKCKDKTSNSDCYRWPALAADKYAVGHYGTVDNGLVINGTADTGGSYAMRMGALLAIPATTDLSTLELKTTPAKQLAWTLQNYGAYIVDDALGPNYALSAEDGADGSFMKQFYDDWHFNLNAIVKDNTPWSNDFIRLMMALQVVDNNSSTTIGGGGEPLQPLAPALPSLLPQH